MTDPEITAVARMVATDLVAEGASAVVLAGSQVRGDATGLSDVDLYAIGSGSPYTLRVVRGRLVAISWRSEDDERRALRQPASVGAVVPAWRAAHVLHDPDGVAEGLKREAEAFDWAAISTVCDEWVAEATTGYAEEVLKLVAHAAPMTRCWRRCSARCSPCACRGSWRFTTGCCTRPRIGCGTWWRRRWATTGRLPRRRRLASHRVRMPTVRPCSCSR